MVWFGYIYFNSEMMSYSKSHVKLHIHLAIKLNMNLLVKRFKLLPKFYTEKPVNDN